MKASIEIKADVLKTLIVEDREEIRGIRLTIYNVVTLLSTASFAITAFLLKDLQTIPIQKATQIFFMADVLILILLLGFFIRLKKALECGRKSLKARQNLINDLGKQHISAEGVEEVEEAQDLNPFPNTENVKPDITDSELWWLPAIATVAILIKLFAIAKWLCWP